MVFGILGAWLFNMKRYSLGLIICLLAFAANVIVQALPKPEASGTNGMPRTSDGKLDLSGVWVGGGGGGGFGDYSESMELTKWGKEKFNWNRGPEAAKAAGVYRGQHVRADQDPVYHCYPPGLVRLGPPRETVGNGGSSVEILQIPGQVIIVYQYRNSVHRIYTDGREHPKHLQPTWNGHSIGKWEGDTLVVDTVGLRDESWLDSAGHEHSAQLQVLERFRRVDAEHLEIERALTDPISLAKPFTKTVVLRLNPKYDLNENMDGKQYDCTQFMVRKPAFGEGEGGLLGIADHP